MHGLHDEVESQRLLIGRMLAGQVKDVDDVFSLKDMKSSAFSQMCDDGVLAFLRGNDRYNHIKGMPVLNVVTYNLEQL